MRWLGGYTPAAAAAAAASSSATARTWQILLATS